VERPKKKKKKEIREVVKGAKEATKLKELDDKGVRVFVLHHAALEGRRPRVEEEGLHGRIIQDGQARNTS